MAQARRKISAGVDPEIRAHVAATVSRAYLSPVYPDAPNLFWLLADIFRQRAAVGWNTTLSPETTLLAADALDAYMPMPQPPLPTPPEAKFYVDVFARGSAIYALFHDGEIKETVAWAQSTLVAGAAYDRLVEQYPGEKFLQKRRSWVERE
jgi:hypothetical protein